MEYCFYTGILVFVGSLHKHIGALVHISAAILTLLVAVGVEYSDEDKTPPKELHVNNACTPITLDKTPITSDNIWLLSLNGMCIISIHKYLSAPALIGCKVNTTHR